MSQNPIPQGKYKPAVRHGDLIFTAGMTPRKNGVLLMSGKITPDRPLDDYREAVIQAASNALTAAQNTLKEGERIVQILSHRLSQRLSRLHHPRQGGRHRLQLAV